jgi:SAM-dependent methyltransferase
VSALKLHWVNDLPGTLLQIRKALKPDGLFLGALFGGATLHELRDAMLQAEAETSGGVSPRVAPFADLKDIGHLMQRAGFALPVTDADIVTVRYDTVFHLFRDLKAMGETSILNDRRRVPATRKLLQRTAEIYQNRFADKDGRLPATFEILYATGWAPHESQQKPIRPGTAKMSLAAALKDQEDKKGR